MGPVDKLSAVLSRLPGVGKRSAERMALKLARDSNGLVKELVTALQEVESKIGMCSLCGNITFRAEDPCSLCRDPRREGRVICVVEDPGDILLIERAGGFKGRYHAMMGKISPMKGEGIGNLRLESLIQRVKQEGIEEVILALNSDVESDATAAFLHHVLSSSKVKITRLALGIPAGSEIAYSDPVTLSRAIRGRTSL